MARRTSRTIPGDLVPIGDEVDKTFGEPAVLKPMSAGSYRDSVVDDSRPPIIARGIYDQTRGAVESTGGTMLHRQVTVDTSLSIRAEPILQCGLKKGDRVFFPERDELYEVTFIHADPGGRPDVHLVRVLEDE